jgi:hypothetical protein
MARDPDRRREEIAPTVLTCRSYLVVRLSGLIGLFCLSCQHQTDQRDGATTRQTKVPLHECRGRRRWMYGKTGSRARGSGVAEEQHPSIRGLLKKVAKQDRSKRRGDPYSVRYGESLNRAGTPHGKNRVPGEDGPLIKSGRRPMIRTARCCEGFPLYC